MKHHRFDTGRFRQRPREIACIFPRHTRAGLWRVVWTMSVTLMLAAAALVLLALLTPQGLRAHVVELPQSISSEAPAEHGVVSAPAAMN